MGKYYSDDEVGQIHPSQLVNIGWTLAGILGCMTVVLPLYMMYRWYIIDCWTYTFNQYTIVERKGVFDKTQTEVHYHRVKSIKVDQPFWMGLFGICTVTIVTSDPLVPVLTLYGINDWENLEPLVKEMIQVRREEKGVREFDTYQL